MVEKVKWHTDSGLMEVELRSVLPIIFGSSKMTSLWKKFYSKGPSLWVVKEVKDDGTVEIEIP